MNGPSTTPPQRSGMRWVSHATSSARQRLHRPSNSRRRPTFHEWGDIDGPGERSATTEFMPIVPFEPERMLQNRNYYYLQGEVKDDDRTETDADTEVYSWDDEETVYTSLSSMSMTTPSSASLLSSRDSLMEIKERTQAPTYASDLERSMHQLRLSGYETQQHLLESATKTHTKLHMPKLRLQRKKQSVSETEKEYESILKAQYAARERRLFR